MATSSCLVGGNFKKLDPEKMEVVRGNRKAERP